MNIDNAKSQMRKGMLEYCVLLLLHKEPSYASDIISKLKEAQLIVVEGTLYPLLTRLKKDGLLSYEWKESTQGPPRKYYALTSEGENFLDGLDAAWNELAATVACQQSTFGQSHDSVVIPCVGRYVGVGIAVRLGSLTRMVGLTDVTPVFFNGSRIAGLAGGLAARIAGGAGVLADGDGLTISRIEMTEQGVGISRAAVLVDVYNHTGRDVDAVEFSNRIGRIGRRCSYADLGRTVGPFKRAPERTAGDNDVVNALVELRPTAALAVERTSVGGISGRDDSYQHDSGHQSDQQSLYLSHVFSSPYN